jgi:hypothetical protein
MIRALALTACMVAILVTVSYQSEVQASTDAVNAASVSPTLQVSVTVVKAIRLTLAQGGGAGACAVNPAADYSLSFGSVDALAITAPLCGSKFAPTTAGVTPSAYYTDYQITPVFANQAAASATVSAYVSSNFATLSNVLTVVQSTAAPGNIAALSPMSTNVGAQTAVGAGLASGVAVTRYIGVTVAPTNSNVVAVSGADSATVTYTMTVP